MASYVEIERLAALLKAKRGKRGLREIAVEMGEVSPSTLSRVENGKMPDMDTFLRVCDWLEIAPSELIKSPKVSAPPEVSSLDMIEVQLRASKELEPTMAKALADMVKAAAQNASKDQE